MERAPQLILTGRSYPAVTREWRAKNARGNGDVRQQTKPKIRLVALGSLTTLYQPLLGSCDAALCHCNCLPLKPTLLPQQDCELGRELMGTADPLFINDSIFRWTSNGHCTQHTVAFVGMQKKLYIC